MQISLDKLLLRECGGETSRKNIASIVTGVVINDQDTETVKYFVILIFLRGSSLYFIEN